MTEDQTRSYRNSLRGTNYGRTVYGDHSKQKSAFESREGAEEDDDNIFDQSDGSDDNENPKSDNQKVSDSESRDK